MDVLLISRCPPFPLYHGDRLIPYHLARELSARRYHIDLLAFYQRPEDVAEVPRYEKHFNSVTLLPEPRRSLRSYWQRQRQPARRFPSRASESWSPAMWAAIDKAIRERAYDVVHLFGGVHVYEYWPLASQLPNLIVPYESYTLWLERALAEETRRIPRLIKGVQLRMARQYESWMFDRYQRVVVLTELDAQALTRLNPATPTAVIPNGVDLDYLTPTGYEPDEPTLLFIGNYDYLPNRDAALRLVRDIFPRIRQRMSRARLIIVGGNPPPDTRTYFESALIFISPLRLGAGIKNKILEAMAMETPVVATPLSCDGIPVTPEEHVLLGTTDDELANAVFRLFQDPRLRRHLQRNGRQLVEQQFTWHHVAEQYDALYAQVIDEHRRRVLSDGENHNWS